MKKHFKLLSLLVALMVIIGSISFSKVAIAVGDECYREGSFTIYAGNPKNNPTTVGTVYVKLYQNKIVFNFDLDERVTAREYHINVLSVPPTEKGEPGHYSYTGIPSTTNDFDVEVTHNFKPGETIYLMTHLTVNGTNDKNENINNDTAYAGDQFGGENSWFVYFSMVVPVCEKRWEGTIRVEKSVIDEKHQSPDKSGFKFTLVGPNNYNQTISTDINGIAEFTGLLEGQYTLTEETEEEFINDLGESKIINLNAENYPNKTATIIVTNTKVYPTPTNDGMVKIIKKLYDQEIKDFIEIGQNYSFTFKLYSVVDNVETEVRTGIISNSNQLVFESLPYGEYILKEVLPVGYTSDNNEKSFFINAELKTYIIEVTNTKLYDPYEWRGTLVINKGFYFYPEDIEPMNVTSTDLSGFEFEIWKDEVKIAGPLPTDNNGVVVFESLLAGTYEIKETNTKGYAPKGPFKVTISPNQEDPNLPINLDFYNWLFSPKDIVIQKVVVDEDNESPDLSGFTFRLYRQIYENNTFVREEFVEAVTTGLNGKAVFQKPIYDFYTIYEDPRDGYIMGIDANGISIEHLPNSQYPVIVTNTKIPNPTSEWEGSIKVNKTVSDPRNNNPNKSGFTFNLYSVTDSEEVYFDSKITDEKGIAEFQGLNPGTYKLYENAKSGYILGIASTGRTIILDNNTAPNKLIAIDITNTVIYPEDPGDSEDPDDPDDPEDPVSKTPDDPEEETIMVEEIPQAIPDVPEEEEVIIEEIPEAVPEVVEEILPEPEEEVVEIEELIPQAAPTLPATGAISEYLYYGLGGLALAIGEFIRRRKR